MNTLNKVKAAMLRPIAVTDSTRAKVAAAKSVEECLHILNTEYGGANSMPFAIAFLDVVEALKA